MAAVVRWCPPMRQTMTACAPSMTSACRGRVSDLPEQFGQRLGHDRVEVLLAGDFGAATNRSTPAARHGDTISMLNHASASPPRRWVADSATTCTAGAGRTTDRDAPGRRPARQPSRRDRCRPWTPDRFATPPARSAGRSGTSGRTAPTQTSRRPPVWRDHPVADRDANCRPTAGPVDPARGRRRRSARADERSSHRLLHRGSRTRARSRHRRVSEGHGALRPEIDDPSRPVGPERPERGVVLAGVQHHLAALSRHRRPTVGERLDVIRLGRFDSPDAERTARHRQIRTRLTASDHMHHGAQHRVQPHFVTRHRPHRRRAQCAQRTTDWLCGGLAQRRDQAAPPTTPLQQVPLRSSLPSMTLGHTASQLRFMPEYSQRLKALPAERRGPLTWCYWWRGLAILNLRPSGYETTLLRPTSSSLCPGAPQHGRGEAIVRPAPPAASITSERGRP